jgi:HK97 family phage portal protein
VGVFSRFARFFNLSGRVSPEDPWRHGYFLPLPYLPSGMRLSLDESTQLSVVWACIRLITEAMASSPVAVYGLEGRKRTLLYDDSIAFLLNRQSNRDDGVTAIAWKEAMFFSALTHGDGYSEVLFDGAGRTSGLRYLWADRVQVRRDEKTADLLYHYMEPMGGEKVLEPWRVFHLKGPSVSGLMGSSIVARAARAAALAAAAERFSVSYLANGATPSGLLEYPNKLDEQTLKRLRAQFSERQTGADNAGKTIILEGGMKYVPTQSNPDDAQLIETQQWSVEQIARYFGVPLVLLGVQAAAQGYGTNVSQLNLQWSRMGLAPWKGRFEQEANSKLFSARGQYREVVIDTEWLTRGDAIESAKADAERIRSGVFSVNEVREKLGMNTIGTEGDMRFVEAALQPLTETLLEIQEQAAKPPEPKAMPAKAPAGEEEEEDDDEGAKAEPVFRQAIMSMVIKAFSRAEKAMQRRAEHLRGRGFTEKQIAKNLEEERVRLRERLVDECAPALELIRSVAASQGRHINGEADIEFAHALAAFLDLKAKPEVVANTFVTHLLPESHS